MKAHAEKYPEKFGHELPLIHHTPEKDTGIIVVIPCHDEPDVSTSVQSLYNCRFPGCHTEIIVVVNASENDAENVLETNRKSTALLSLLKDRAPEHIDLHVIECNNFPRKHAGVGLARKTGMDEAVLRFNSIGMNGIIACFDADSLCEADYLFELNKHFNDHPESPACSVYFEHPVSGDQFDDRVYRGIVNYELHLRYYRLGLEYAAYPYPFHTIGSSMASQVDAYCKAGGMNKRKAGEDFYFLQKMMLQGHYSELNKTRVIPSPRPSHRVPFGTGKAIEDWLRSETGFLTYHPDTFGIVKDSLTVLEGYYSNPVPVTDMQLENAAREFLCEQEADKHLRGIRERSGNAMAYRKHLYIWMNRFLLLKMVHYLRDHSLGEVPVVNAARKLLEMNGIMSSEESSLDLLMTYRQLDRER